MKNFIFLNVQALTICDILTCFVIIVIINVIRQTLIMLLKHFIISKKILRNVRKINKQLQSKKIRINKVYKKY